MQISSEVLKEAAQAGSQEASIAFSKLAGGKVVVKTAVVEVLSHEFITTKIKSEGPETILACTQGIEGVKGVSILMIPRKAAFTLVDLLNHQAAGTTSCLKDLERSAIKETLNILSNAYLNALAQKIGKKLMMGSPYLMTAEHTNHLLHKIQEYDFSVPEMIMFETSLLLAQHQVEVSLFIIFDQEFADYVQNI